MIKLITPPGMLLTVALLAIYSAYAFLIGSIEDSWVLLAGGFASLIACYGTAMLRPWSKYLVYALAAGYIAKLGSSLYQAYRAGFFVFQFRTSAEIAWSLAPSLAMTLLSLTCCAMVYLHFDGHPGPVDPTT